MAYWPSVCSTRLNIWFQFKGFCAFFSHTMCVLLADGPGIPLKANIQLIQLVIILSSMIKKTKKVKNIDGPRAAFLEVVSQFEDGTQFFCFHIHFPQKVSTLDIGTPSQQEFLDPSLQRYDL